MLSREQCVLRNLKMSRDWSNDRDRLEFAIANQFAAVGRRARAGIPTAHGGQSHFVGIADPSQLRSFILRKVAQQVWAPITAADYANCGRRHRVERIAAN